MGESIMMMIMTMMSVVMKRKLQYTLRLASVYSKTYKNIKVRVPGSL